MAICDGMMYTVISIVQDSIPLSRERIKKVVMCQVCSCTTIGPIPEIPDIPFKPKSIIPTAVVPPNIMGVGA